MANNKKTNVELMFDELDDIQRHETLLSYIQYPRTKKLSQHDKPAERCTYTCFGGLCDLDDVQRCIDQSVELRAFGCQKTAKMVMYE